MLHVYIWYCCCSCRCTSGSTRSMSSWPCSRDRRVRWPRYRPPDRRYRRPKGRHTPWPRLHTISSFSCCKHKNVCFSYWRQSAVKLNARTHTRASFTVTFDYSIDTDAGIIDPLRCYGFIVGPTRCFSLLVFPNLFIRKEEKRAIDMRSGPSKSGGRLLLLRQRKWLSFYDPNGADAANWDGCYNRRVAAGERERGPSHQLSWLVCIHTQPLQINRPLAEWTRMAALFPSAKRQGHMYI